MHLMQKVMQGLLLQLAAAHGIIGTSLAGLLALGAGNNGNGGFLSGLFGGNNNNCQNQK